MARIEPRNGTATRRRELRRRMRNGLGTTRDSAPEAVEALYVAHNANELLELATDGRFGVAIIDRERGTFVGLADALRTAKGQVS